MSKRDFTFDKPDESPGFLLWQVTNLWQRELKKALETFNLTHSQFVLLASVHWLTLNGQKVTQVMLSQHTKIDPMTASTVLRTLQKKSLLQRQEHEQDARAKTVELTSEGLSTVVKAIQEVERFDNSFFGALGNDLTDFNTKLNSLLTQNP